jgi:SRSO17 transposase
MLSSRFARVRVRAAHRDYNLTESRSEEWLLIEWPRGEEEPTKYWLSTVPETIAFHRLVDLAKLRWRIERDYQELKQEVGLGHYEGRGWRGLHHHRIKKATANHAPNENRLPRQRQAIFRLPAESRSKKFFQKILSNVSVTCRDAKSSFTLLIEKRLPN